MLLSVEVGNRDILMLLAKAVSHLSLYNNIIESDII